MHPGLLWLLLLIIPLTVWYVMKSSKSDPSMRMPTTQAFDKMPRSWKEWLRHVMFAMEMLALACLIIILCRPQSNNSWSKTDIEGTDIVLALDVSGSMLAKDFKPNRLDAAKDVAIKFVQNRTSDNIGLVVFAGEAFTQVPMTNDIATLVNYIGNIQIGMLEDGTAVGDGIATAINRIKDGKAKSKSIILLTDGSNNTGVVGPLTAAQIAAKYDIKVYAIGVGTMGQALYPTLGINGQIEYTMQKVEIDEKSLQQIAATTGGKYFRATSKSTLRNIFAEIDKLEKTRMDVQRHSQMEDNYQPWAIALLLLLAMCAIIRYTILKSVP
ncbi:MAG: VWA domain-containing protein [Muribaculaceae bacterium]|nr:VWA domain-containing protein [Muribaculaceae bacterium]